MTWASKLAGLVMLYDINPWVLDNSIPWARPVVVQTGLAAHLAMEMCRDPFRLASVRGQNYREDLRGVLNFAPSHL